MAVIWTNRVAAGRGSAWSIDGKRTYTEKWLAKTDTITDGPGVVRNAFPLGGIYAHVTEFDTGAWRKSVDVQQHGSTPTLWDVTCDYDSDYVPIRDENPLLRPIEWDYEFYAIDEYRQADLDGKKFVNTAGQPFDVSEVAIKRTIAVALFKLNRASFSLVAITDWLDSVNSSPFLGASAGQLKLTEYKPTPKTETTTGAAPITYNYVEIHGRIEWNPKGWKRPLLNRGRVGKKSGKAVNLTDEEGFDFNDPVLLNGSGDALPPGGTPVYTEFRVHDWLDFSVLGLV